VRICGAYARRTASCEGERLWVTDTTYVPTWEGLLFLAVVIDAFSRRCVGWSMRDLHAEPEEERGTAGHLQLHRALLQPDQASLDTRSGELGRLRTGQCCRQLLGQTGQRSSAPSSRRSGAVHIFNGNASSPPWEAVRRSPLVGGAQPLRGLTLDIRRQFADKLPPHGRTRPRTRQHRVSPEPRPAQHDRVQASTLRIS